MRFFNKNSIAVESLILIAAQVASIFGSLGLVKVLTTFLGPDEFGALGLALSTTAILNNALLPGILAATSRYYSVAAESREMPAFLSAISWLGKHLAILFLLLLSFSALFLLVTKNQKWIALNFFIWIFAFTNAIAVIYAGIQNAARNRVSYAALYAFDPWVRIILCVFIFGCVAASSTSAGGAYALSSFILMLIQYFLFNKYIINRDGNAFFQVSSTNVPRRSKLYWRLRLIKYGLPFCVAGAFLWLQQNSGRWVLELFSTRENIGFLVVLNQLGFSSVQIIVTVFLNIINPIIIFRGINNLNEMNFFHVRKFIYKISLFGLSFTVLLALITQIFHEAIFTMLVGEKYLKISHFLPLMILAGGTYGVSQLINSLPIFLAKSGTLVAPMTVSVFLSIFVALLLTPIYGLGGVILSFCIFSLTHLIVNILCLNKKKL